MRSFYRSLCLFGLSLAVTPMLADDAKPEAEAKQSRLKIGEVVPSLWGTNCSGDAAMLQDRRQDLVLVEFWSLSDQERPATKKRLLSIRDEFLTSTNPKFRILSFCVDDDWEDWWNYCNAQEDMKDAPEGIAKFYGDRCWWQLSMSQGPDGDTKKQLASYEVTTTPCYFLVKPGGNLVAAKIPSAKLQEVVSQQMKEIRGE